MNLDEYIHTTENGVKNFQEQKKTKAILNLNPAIPCINMQTTIMAKVAKPNIEALKPTVRELELIVKKYVPGYEIIVGPVLEDERIFVTAIRN